MAFRPDLNALNSYLPPRFDKIKNVTIGQALMWITSPVVVPIGRRHRFAIGLVLAVVVALDFVTPVE
jgi:hypothetical protein